MKFTVGDVEDFSGSGRMRNSQLSRSRYIPIINQRAPIETISDGDKAMTCQGMCQPFVVSLDTGTINRTQTQHGTQRLTVGAPRIQDNLFGRKFGLGVKSVRMNQKDNFSLDLNLFSPYFVPSNLKFKGIILIGSFSSINGITFPAIPFPASIITLKGFILLTSIKEKI